MLAQRLLIEIRWYLDAQSSLCLEESQSLQKVLRQTSRTMLHTEAHFPVRWLQQRHIGNKVHGKCNVETCIQILTLLLRSQERWQSIVMSTSVCVSVREHIFRTMHAIFTIFFVHVAYRRGSVLLQRGDAIARGRGQFLGCLPHRQCIVQHSTWDPYIFDSAPLATLCENTNPQNRKYVI